jgi:SAM-dependent methyltransferase
MMAGHEILECRACGSAYAATIPDGEHVAAVYDTLYASGAAYERHRQEVAVIRHAMTSGKWVKVGWERRRFFARAGVATPATLLDVGCGTGLFLVAASQRGWDPVGVEVSPEAAFLGSQVHGFPVHVGRIEDLRGRFGPFRAVTVWEVLEHLPHPQKFLMQARELLLPGGILCGSVPNYARPRYRYGDDLGEASVPPVHLNFWTPAALERVLRKAGFCDAEVLVPRVCVDLLRPFRKLEWRKVGRFMMVALGRDVPTEMFFWGVNSGEGMPARM